MKNTPRTVIGLTEPAIKKTLGRNSSLEAITVEIKAMSNDRPVMYVYLDFNNPKLVMCLLPTYYYCMAGEYALSLSTTLEDQHYPGDDNMRKKVDKQTNKLISLTHFGPGGNT